MESEAKNPAKVAEEQKEASKAQVNVNVVTQRSVFHRDPVAGTSEVSNEGGPQPETEEPLEDSDEGPHDCNMLRSLACDRDFSFVKGRVVGILVIILIAFAAIVLGVTTVLRVVYFGREYLDKTANATYNSTNN